MSKTEAYCQFPLCLLAYGRDKEERLRLVMDFTARTIGKTALASPTPELRMLWSQLFAKAKESILEFIPSNQVHQELAIGGESLEICYRSFFGIEETLAGFDVYHTTFKYRFGNDALVRLRLDLVLEAYNQQGISYCELSVLAAIFSVIGRKRSPVQITLETIRVRALGYRTPAIERAEFKLRNDGAVPFTRSQLRTIVASLHERGFFQRFTFRRRRTFYGIGMTENEFRTGVIETLCKRQVYLRNEKLKDEELNREILRYREGSLSELSDRLAKATPAQPSTKRHFEREGRVRPVVIPD